MASRHLRNVRIPVITQHGQPCLPHGFRVRRVSGSQIGNGASDWRQERDQGTLHARVDFMAAVRQPNSSGRIDFPIFLVLNAAWPKSGSLQETCEFAAYAAAMLPTGRTSICEIRLARRAGNKKNESQCHWKSSSESAQKVAHCSA